MPGSWVRSRLGTIAPVAKPKQPALPVADRKMLTYLRRSRRLAVKRKLQEAVEPRSPNSRPEIRFDLDPLECVVLEEPSPLPDPKVEPGS